MQSILEPHPTIKQEWISRAQTAGHELQNAYVEIGAEGVADSLLNDLAAIDEPTLRKWQQRFLDEYNDYRRALSDFTQYMSQYVDKTS